jgi:hypothetical protein
MMASVIVTMRAAEHWPCGSKYIPVDADGAKFVRSIILENAGQAELSPPPIPPKTIDVEIRTVP